MHGHILGYRIYYAKVSEADEAVTDQTFVVKTVPLSVNEVYLEYLSTYCTYRIQIVAFTSKGEGPRSEPIFTSMSFSYITCIEYTLDAILSNGIFLNIFI